MDNLLKEDYILVKIIIINLLLTGLIFIVIYYISFIFNIINIDKFSLWGSKGIFYDFVFLQFIFFPFSKLNYLKKNLDLDKSYLLNFKKRSIIKKVIVTFFYVIIIIILKTNFWHN
jgi:hypothetical protein